MKGIKPILFLLLPLYSLSQQEKIDSVKQAQIKQLDSFRVALKKASADSARYRVLGDIIEYYQETNRDSALHYEEQRLSLAVKNNKELAEAYSLTWMGYQFTHTGRYSEAYKCLLRAFEIANDPKSEKTHFLPADSGFRNQRLKVLELHYYYFGVLLSRTNNIGQAIAYHYQARKLAEELNMQGSLVAMSMSLGHMFLGMNELDSALIYVAKAEKIAKETGINRRAMSIALVIKGNIYFKKGLKREALASFHEAIQTANEYGYRGLSSLVRAYFSLAAYYIAEKQKDSSLFYSRKAKDGLGALGGISGTEWNIGKAYENLYQSFRLNNKPDSVFKYLALAKSANDSLNNDRIKSLSEFQNLLFEEKLRLDEKEKEQVVHQGKVRAWFMLSGIGVLLLLAIIFYRNIRQKQKSKIKIEKAYDDLKTTQQQLIQSEKMASLGELTAGIAHEIQNPLNFVNNFSEVNNELVDELKSELARLGSLGAVGNMLSAIEIADNIKLNEQKISHHGKRADSIVKGMLQHSRVSTGQKQLTDINALCDEYLRLAYHGLRAKDKSFNAKFETDFDPTIEKINVVPQDIGRVILNLINNAFYAVSEKKKELRDGYEPTVLISTKKLDGKIEIKVKDNGNGIPQKVLDKVFQPFFTTKPTGQGTGLGLSLSYDIIKVHGGEIKVETKEGEGSEFIIMLPVV